MEIIDLRETSKGCKEHPLVKLKRIISEMERGPKIKVITNTKIVPLKIVEILAKRKGTKYVFIKINDKVYEVIIEY